MVGGQIANQAGFVFYPIGMMMEGPREEKNGQGNKEKVNRFFKQIAYPPRQVKFIVIRAMNITAAKTNFSALFSFCLLKKGKRKIGLDW